MKKTLALVLAFALVFSTMTMAFADDAAAISADAKICADLGMLVGDGSGVTTAYTATSPNRLQAAVMFLRLKGLEAEANAFTGTDTFADAKKVAWGQPVMAYLKAHPELGWIGDGTNFDPASAMTAQQYYKVMLEALGYKQNTATVVGDFTWENVMTFAASKGLTKNAAVTSFTVNDLAVATVEALKATVKDGNKTLVATLVEAGKVDKAKAIASGVMADTATTDAKLDSVVASANDKIEVTFDADVAKDFAENVANYKVVVKGSTTALEVKSAKAVNSTIVELATAVQTGGTAYTLTVGEVSKNFAGLAKNTAVPEIDTVKCIDTNTVEIVFKKAVDRTSAEDATNYTLNNGATVKSAELWIDQDDSRKTVKLTAEGIAKSKVYKVKVANVKSADLVAIKTTEKNFSGYTDTTAAKVSSVTAVNNQRIFVVFDDAHGVDKATVENIANWSIDDGLTINSIKASDYVDCNGKRYGLADDYGYLDVVEINTEPMTANHKYTITISNLVDGSYSKNVISKALTKTFYGLAVDKTAPKIGNVAVIGDSMLEIPFTETNRLDYATATDVNNYTLTEGLQVLSAKVLRSSKPDDSTGKLVVLTTSTMDKDTTYKLTVANVADEFGNVMTTISNRSLPRSQGAKISPPAVEKVLWKDKNSVQVFFKDRLDIDSANDPANYSINNDIGIVKKAEISGASGYVRVDLTTPDLSDNKSYKLTINGVKDRLGNELSSYVVSFKAGMSDDDIAVPTIENISAVSNQEVQVTFDKAVRAASTAAMQISFGNTVMNLNVAGLSAAKNVTDDGYTVSFVSTNPAGSKAVTTSGVTTTTANTSTTKINTNDEITIESLTGITDKHNNQYVVDNNDKPTFYGNGDTDNDAPEVTGVDEINMRKIRVTFSKPILQPTAAIGGKLNGTTNSSIFAAGTLTVDKDDDRTNDTLSTLTIDAPAKIIAGTQYVFNFSNVKDYVGAGSSDTAYDYYADLDDTDAPVIDYVESVNTKKVQVHYNEELSATGKGTYSITGSFVKSTNAATTKTITSGNTSLNGDDKSIVDLDVSTLSLVPGEIYTLKPISIATDIAGNKSDIKDVSFDFVASAIVEYNYITGVSVNDATEIVVSGSKAFTFVSVLDSNSNNIAGTVYNPDGDEATVTLTEPLLSGAKYTVNVTGLDTNTYVFYGIITDGGLEEVSNNVITFSDWTEGTYVVTIVYGGTTEVATSGPNGYVFTTSIAPNAEFLVTVQKTDATNPIIYAARIVKQ